MKKILFLLFAATLIAGSWYAYREFTRKPGNANSESTDFKLTAEELRAEFDNEDTANKKLLNKYIEVTGTVESVSPNEGTTDILLSTEDPMTGINIHLISEENEKVKSVKPGEKITVKGKCNGKLSDIELNAGIILD
ncbi:MAG TPA: hypothetical protein PK637_01335 [Flavobacteriales bacterium]|nr:hypothetical protein [Flavobacteriales bacterium]HRE74999.1 hypothetical protein [Flavobacteriales bacterium]HRE95375.1 hypothetical protein [Flavobacteriales bacterium]HRJ34550.1 hypothetical protein [Flavobacteriales bacterium]HRJ38111.1 hypothetical protein [Flavobacteriales bacterium]